MDHAVIALLAGIAATACGSDPAFRCETDAQCALDGVDGVCEATHYCSFIDPSCDGRRYAESAGDGLAGACVHVSIVGETNDATIRGGTTDAELDAAAPTANRGGLDNLTIDPDGTAVLRFELSSLPATAIVERAELRVEVIETGELSVDIHPLVESWDEQAVSWNQRQTGVPWTSPGAGAASRASAQAGAFSAVQLGPASAALAASTVQGWIAAPGANHGVVLSTRSAAGATIASSQEGVAASRPHLVITWR